MNFELFSQLIIKVIISKKGEKMMKKQLGLIVISAALLLAACGQDNAKTTDSKKTTAEKTEQTTKTATYNKVNSKLQEPTEDTKCAFCNMKVYEANHEMGAFSAQAIKEDGSTIFFDDIGCMLNQERKDKVQYDKYVRDYDSKEWLKLGDAVIVKAAIKTPMNYGYAFFKDEESANSFIKKHDGAKIVKISDVDGVANERYKKKMQKMKNNDSGEKMDMDMNN